MNFIIKRLKNSALALRDRFQYRKTPSIQQVQRTECGAASLAIVLAHYGRWESINALRNTCDISRDGCTALDIRRAADEFGLSTTGYKYPAHLLRAVRLPAIIHWEFQHFCVLEGFRGNDYLINDPAEGHRRMSHERFVKSYTGVVLEFEKREDFQQRGRQPRIQDSLWPWFEPHRWKLFAAVLCGLFIAVPTLGIPVLLGMFVDYSMSQEHANMIPIVGGVALAGLLLFVLTYIQHHVLVRVGIRVSIEQAERFISTILRLPVDYFAQRYAGDIAARTWLIDNVTEEGSTQLIGLLMEFVISIVLLAWIISIDGVLASAILGLVALNVLALRTLSRYRMHENLRLRQEQGRLLGVGTMVVERLDSVIASGRINSFFAQFTGYQARELAIRQRFGELSALISAFPVVIQLLSTAIVLYIGSARVVALDMTLGDLMAVFFLTVRFLLPFSRFVDAADRLNVLGADLQRIDDVVTAQTTSQTVQQEQSKEEQNITLFGGKLRLSGQLEIRDLSFGYRREVAPLFSNFNLKVMPGQRTAVIGPSGSGKSTLAALVAGLREPWSGEILFDGCPMHEIPSEIMTDSVAFVDQHVHLFSSTVRENLTMWNSTVPDSMMVAAAKDARIHDEIVRRPLAYDSLVKAGGLNFSSGQRQRLEIARALIYNPTLIILDEATSDLDPIVEHEINDAIRRRGCACLVIAHRLSTIRDSDEIVVLDRQGVAQRGKHDELLNDPDNALYRELIVNE